MGTETYVYDTYNRLTDQKLDGTTYATVTYDSYGRIDHIDYPNAGQMRQTIDGTTTSFCYDYADRLITATNSLYNAPVYDAHGNTTKLGTGSTPLRLYYDASDRNSGFEQYDSTTTGTAMYYDRDVQGRIVGRYKNTIANGNWVDAGDYYYDYTGTGDTPDYIRNPNWDIVEKNVELPGGVVATIKPLQTGNNQKSYNLPNIHGDVLVTTNAAGTNTSNGNGPLNSFTYDPFGNVLAGSTLPANTALGSYGYVGQHEKLTESMFTLTPIQMGARVYLPQLGRFAQVDPIEGGTPSSYVYPGDPVNEGDLSGMMSQRGRQSHQPKRLSAKEQKVLDMFRKTNQKPKGKDLKLLNSAIQKNKTNQKLSGERRSREIKDVGRSAGKSAGKAVDFEYVILSLFFPWSAFQPKYGPPS